MKKGLAMREFYTLDDIDVQGKRVVLRLDLNVPMQNGRILDETRIISALPTLKELQQKKAIVFILAHLGRPQGEIIPELSLAPVAEALEKHLGHKIYFAGREAIGHIQPGHIAMLENIRFHPGEEKNDQDLAELFASLGDFFVNDAFSVSHRAHASVEAITHILPAVAGRQLEKEVKNLTHFLKTPQKPVLAIVGGSKISTKITVLEKLIEKVDVLAPVGGIANTFLKAQGYNVGRSIVEDTHLETARFILQKAEAQGCRIFLPSDVVVAEELRVDVPVTVCPSDQIDENMMILDMGPQSTSALCEEISHSRTILWNGPLGACEVKPFDTASLHIARYIADQKDAFSIAGGGETVMMLEAAGVVDELSYVSTAGGAFLEMIEGRNLPGLSSLKRAVLQQKVV